MSPETTILYGDAWELAATLEPQSIDCIVTSPPYWGLRDYGHPDQFGLERTPQEYVAKLVDLFARLRPALKDEGTVWLNLGDSYNAYNGGAGPGSQLSKTQTEQRPRMATGYGLQCKSLKPKDLVGIPWRVAFALQEPQHTGPIKEERDRAWMAGLVDGEGCLTILQTTSPHGSGDSYPPVLQVQMTDDLPLLKCHAITGYGKASPAQSPPSQPGQRDSYQWRIVGRKAADVAAELYPFLLVKRQQAIVLWNHQKVRDSYQTKRGVRIPAEAVAKQQLCRDLIQRMNAGESCDIPSWMVEPPALEGPGWYLRSDCIWAKPNPMPESVTDRPTKAHEYLFLLAKSKRYYFDQEAVMEPAESGPSDIKKMLEGKDRIGGLVKEQADPRMKASALTNIGRKRSVGGKALTSPRHDGNAWNENDGRGFIPTRLGRNIRTVWTIATQPYPEAHFATFPPKLIEPCIKAGTSERGVCPECGRAWDRQVERVPGDGDLRCHGTSPGAKHLQGPLSRLNSGTSEQYHANRDRVLTRGWSATCTCDAAPVPATVLDPFMGSGTTAEVARKLGRNCVGFELNEDYRPLIEDRLKQGVLL